LNWPFLSRIFFLIPRQCLLHSHLWFSHYFCSSFFLSTLLLYTLTIHFLITYPWVHLHILLSLPVKYRSWLTFIIFNLFIKYLSSRHYFSIPPLWTQPQPSQQNPGCHMLHIFTWETEKVTTTYPYFFPTTVHHTCAHHKLQVAFRGTLTYLFFPSHWGRWRKFHQPHFTDIFEQRRKARSRIHSFIQ
jgi:hypothetical protein